MTVASAISIQDFRISFIWFETQLSLLGNKVLDSSVVPLAFLGRNYTYEHKFGQAAKDTLEIQGTTGKIQLMLPWKSPSRQLFWIRYMKGNNAENVTPTLAWNGFVPFRGTVPLQIKAPWLKGRFFLEAYYYPHGVALVANAYCNDTFTLDKALEMAFQIRRAGRFEVEMQGQAPGTVRQLSLDALANMAMNVLRTQAWGSNMSHGPSSITPFSIFTVVQGNGVKPKVAITPNGEVHRALEAVTRWSTTYQYDKLTPLRNAKLSIKQSPSSHILYASKKGRAVWFPGNFMLPGISSLACYHRNLLFTSLQIESLCGLVAESEKQIPGPPPLPSAQRERLHRAVEILDCLYRGDISTYRTCSAPAQIEEMAPEINNVRKFLSRGPLF